MSTYQSTPACKPYHHGNLAIELVRIASQTLEAEGALGLSLRRIAQQAGVSASALYRHFSDKEALLQQVAEGGFRQLLDHFTDALDRAPDQPQHRLHALGLAYMGFAFARPHLYDLMFGPLHPPSASPDNASPDSASQSCFRLLSEAVRQCLPPQADEQSVLNGALALWSAVHGYVGLVRGKQIPDGGDHWQEQAAMILAALNLSAISGAVSTGADRP